MRLQYRDQARAAANHLIDHSSLARYIGDARDDTDGVLTLVSDLFPPYPPSSGERVLLDCLYGYADYGAVRPWQVANLLDEDSRKAVIQSAAILCSLDVAVSAA